MGMSELAAIRPDSWELPLFIHVLGALTLIGTLALACAFVFSASRGGSGDSLRLAVRSLTLGVIPAWIVLRVSAEWIADEEGLRDLDDPPGWIEMGYIVADVGLLLILVSSLLGWVALRRKRAGAQGPAITTRVAAALVGLLLLVNLVALWAMTTKPG
jgi:hypothetical protein